GIDDFKQQYSAYEHQKTDLRMGHRECVHDICEPDSDEEENADFPVPLWKPRRPDQSRDYQVKEKLVTEAPSHGNDRWNREYAWQKKKILENIKNGGKGRAVNLAFRRKASGQE